MEMGVIEPMDRPKGGALVGSKMVLKKKRDPQGGFLRAKARWTAQGITQRPGVD
jgi:hypothetical protein